MPEATAKIQLSNSLEDGTTFISTNTVFTGNYTPASNEDKKYLYGPGVTVTLGDTFVFTASAQYWTPTPFNMNMMKEIV